MTQISVVACVLAGWSLLAVVVAVGTARMLRNRDRQRPVRPARGARVTRY